MRSTIKYILKIGIYILYFFLNCHGFLHRLFRKLKIVYYGSWRCGGIVKNISKAIISRFWEVMRSTIKYTLKIGIYIFFLFLNCHGFLHRLFMKLRIVYYCSWRGGGIVKNISEAIISRFGEVMRSTIKYTLKNWYIFFLFFFF